MTGEVNPELVRAFSRIGVQAVGLSGKDGNMIVARKKNHPEDGKDIDLGWVGEVAQVDTKILNLLLDNEMLPIVTCMASDELGRAYNINADMVAGHLAGALKADKYIVLTDVDGLYRDFSNLETLIPHLSITETNELIGTAIKGGMIPKIDSALIALEKGTNEVGIINGTKKGMLKAFINNENQGTRITK